MATGTDIRVKGSKDKYFVDELGLMYRDNHNWKVNVKLPRLRRYFQLFHIYVSPAEKTKTILYQK